VIDWSPAKESSGPRHGTSTADDPACNRPPWNAQPPVVAGALPKAAGRAERIENDGPRMLSFVDGAWSRRQAGPRSVFRWSGYRRWSAAATVPIRRAIKAGIRRRRTPTRGAWGNRGSGNRGNRRAGPRLVSPSATSARGSFRASNRRIRPCPRASRRAVWRARASQNPEPVRSRGAVAADPSRGRARRARSRLGIAAQSAAWEDLGRGGIGYFAERARLPGVGDDAAPGEMSAAA